MLLHAYNIQELCIFVEIKVAILQAQASATDMLKAAHSVDLGKCNYLGKLLTFFSSLLHRIVESFDVSPSTG